MHFVQDTWSGRICLLLGLALLVWGACREPMLPTRQVPVPVPVPAAVEEVEKLVAHDDSEKEVLAIVRHEEKSGR